MLDFYRPVALDRKPLDVNSLLERVISLVTKQMEDHNIQLHCNFASNLPPVLAVSDQIQQVFLNLLLNAMEAMPGSGDIFIQTALTGEGSSPIKQASEKQVIHKEVEIFIEDTGPGVSISDRKHIFEPFVSTKDKGIGLGLAVSYGIITAHGGSLDLMDHHTQLAERYRSDLLNNPLGRGACFRVSLPISEHT
jgi:signal transduction histidine kinase